MNDKDRAVKPKAVKKKEDNRYKVFVLQTDEDGKGALETRNSILKYEKDANVKILKEPQGLIGTDGIAAIPIIIDFSGEALVVTDKVLCIGNFAPLLFNKPTNSFSAGLSLNVCLVQPWGADPLDVHWHFSKKYMDLYRKKNISIGNHVSDNYDFSGIFKYKNPPPAPPKVAAPIPKVEKPTFFTQADAKMSPAVPIEPKKVEEKPLKKKGWFRR